MLGGRSGDAAGALAACALGLLSTTGCRARDEQLTSAGRSCADRGAERAASHASAGAIASSPAPVRTASSPSVVAVAPRAFSGACLSEAQRAHGAPRTLDVTGDVATVGYDLAGSDGSPSSFGLSVDLRSSSARVVAAPSARGSAKPLPPGSTSITSSSTTVTVCEATAGCRAVRALGFAGADKSAFGEAIVARLPSALSPDGQRVFLVRHEAGRAEEIYGETYQLDTGARLSRVPIAADEHVDLVSWLGARAVVTACVDEGPGCSAQLLDPATGATTFLELNVYGEIGAYFPVRGAIWAFVGEAGGAITFRNVDDGAESQHLTLFDEADPESPAAVVAYGPHGLLVARGAPRAGELFVVDLESATVTAAMDVETCAR